MYDTLRDRTLDGDTLSKGRYLSYVDVALRQDVCVIGAYLEEMAFRGDALGQTISVGGVPFTVVGVLARNSQTMEEGGNDDRIYIPYENALQLNGSRDVSLYQLTAVSRDKVAEAKALFMDEMQRFYDYEDAYFNAYYVQTMAEQVDTINTMMGVAMAGAGGHRGHQPAGRRNRHHEHHARLCHGADAGDRYPQIPGGQAEGHPPAIHHRGGHYFRRWAVCLASVLASWYPWPWGRCSAGCWCSPSPAVRGHHLQRHAKCGGRGHQLRCQRSHWNAVWVSARQQSGKAQSH